jgi:nitrite reductase/ring-hydroxylating ferredoxin subunit
LKNLKYIILTTFSAILLFVECGKEQQYADIPNVSVNFYIDLSSALYNDLNYTGGWMYYNNAGYRGILLYCSAPDQYLAFERTCPYDADKECARIEVDQTGSFAVDSCCMSEYLLLDGSVHKGPATRPLKQYRTTIEGTLLHVYN